MKNENGEWVDCDFGASYDEVGSVTLDNGIWYDWVTVPYDPDSTDDGAIHGIDDVYLQEITVDNVGVDYTANGDFSKWPDVTGYVTTDNHRYEVTYSNFEKIPDTSNSYQATVTNRRLGSVDVTVEKTWNSGDGTEAQALETALNAAGMSLALKLEFHPSMPSTTENGFAISYEGVSNVSSGDTVCVGGAAVAIQDADGNNVDAIQKVNVPKSEAEKKTEYYFHNLLKYDMTGTVVRYTVVEGLVDNSGQFYTFQQYSALDSKDSNLVNALENWSMTVTEGDYTASHGSMQGGQEESDAQQMLATNSLVGVKDVNWHKERKDAYAYENGQRPDIYLDIYRKVHTAETNTQLELYQKDYHWVPGDGDAVNNWTAVLENLPKYDSLGYEIIYYAVERTVVDVTRFDYAPAQYWWKSNDSEFRIGSRVEVGSEYDDKYTACLKNVVNQDGESGNPYGDDSGFNYALKEEGIFRNTLEGNPNLSGQKLWENVPKAFEMVDLPPVTFAVYRGLASEETVDTAVNPVATLKVTDWASVFENGSYQFLVAYEGDWSMKKEENGDTVYTGVGTNAGNTITVEADGTVTYEPGTFKPTPLPKYDENG